MKKDEIGLDPKHGLNPSVACCRICGAEWGVILLGDRAGKQAPHHISEGLCNDCDGVLKAGGLLIIEVRDGEEGDAPYRTGRIVGITKEAAERMLPPDHLALKSGLCYMEEATLRTILP